MQPPLRLSAVLVIPLVLPGVLRAQEATHRGTEYHYQPGWNYAPTWTMSPSSFNGWDLYSDGGFQPFDGLHGPPPSFWFYRPSPTFWFYGPSSSFRFYDPPPSFWFYRPHSAGHPYH
jgi:hypothetical protein